MADSEKVSNRFQRFFESNEKPALPDDIRNADVLIV